MQTGRDLENSVARRLVAEGYEVFVEPGPDQLPPQLAGFRPDLLARRDDETLVVEVRRRKDRADGRQVEALAEAVRELPGWRFELVLAPREADKAQASWSVQETLLRLQEAKQLIAAGHGEAALILLSAVLEAAGRLAADVNGLPLQPWHSAVLARQLVHNGLIDREDLDLLERVRQERNRLVHGLRTETDALASARAFQKVVSNLLEEISPSLQETR